MLRGAISLMLAMAAVLPTAPLAAQDAQPDAATEGQAPSITELLDQMRGLPDLQPDFDTSQPVVGIGFQIVEGEVRIARVLDGSAAQAAGMTVGMVIQKINGARMAGFSLEEIAKLLGAIDGEITFTIRDADEVRLRKAPIEQQGS